MSTAPLPKFVMFELTNHCDLRCRHCPFHGDGVEKLRDVRHMDTEVWRAGLREIAGWGTELVFQPWAMGEPLLHPQLWEVVHAAKTMGEGRIEVGFYSNGNQWNDAHIQAAFESGLDWVCFSIDGVRKEVFEHYRVGAKLEKVLGSLRALHAERQRRGRGPSIRINMVQYPELADHGDEFVAALRGYADSIMVSRFREVGVRRFSPVVLDRIPCFQLDTLLAMSVDGRVGQCCEDQQVQESLGKFPEATLAEIWNGPRVTELRRAHRVGRYDVSRLCAECDGWTGVFEQPHELDGMHARERTAGTVYEFR